MGSRFAERQQARIQSAATQLVSLFIGLDRENEEDAVNFQATLDFIYSNFDYHRFLATNSGAIKDTVHQLQEKLAISGHEHRSRIFRALVELFLNQYSSPTATSETPFDILRFLFAMSERPTAIDYSFKGLPERSQSVPGPDARAILGPRYAPHVPLKHVLLAIAHVLTL